MPMIRECIVTTLNEEGRVEPSTASFPSRGQTSRNILLPAANVAGIVQSAAMPVAPDRRLHHPGIPRSSLVPVSR